MNKVTKSDSKCLSESSGIIVVKAEAAPTMVKHMVGGTTAWAQFPCVILTD